MSSPISGLIQTIVSLKEIQQRDAAAKLAREQFGLQEQEFGLNQAKAQESTIAMLQDLAHNVTDQSQLEPLIGPLAKHTGLTEDAVSKVLHSTPSSVATTTAAAVQSGAKQLAGSADVPAAQAALNAQPGALALDELHHQIFSGAGGYLDELKTKNPKAYQDFNAQVAMKTGTGMSLGDAMIDSAVQNLSQSERNQLVRIGKGLAPSASETEQLRVAWAGKRLEQRQLDQMAANEDFHNSLALSEARTKLSGEGFKTVNELLKEKRTAVQDFIKGGPTLTEQGIEQQRATINGINAQLRAIAPDIFGPGGTAEAKDLKPGETPGSTSMFLNFWSKGAQP